MAENRQTHSVIAGDFDPQFEHQECINKAKTLFRAAEEAQRFASAGRKSSGMPEA